MMTTDEMMRLRSAGAAVAASAPTQRAEISARAAARCLSGVVQLVSLEHGVEVMQRACADLATRPEAWKIKGPGEVGAATWTIAVIARGITPLCGDAAMISALAWWASETDPAEWQSVAAGAAA